MILQLLVHYYETLVEKGEIARPGWAKAQISYALKIDENGQLLRVLPLQSQEMRGKKTVSVPQQMVLPAGVKRSVGIMSNFLWDNSSYILGTDGKGKPQRSMECFRAAKELHCSLLSNSDDPFAKAICAFFENWDCEAASSNSALADYFEEIIAGSNITFMYKGEYPQSSRKLQTIWQDYYDGGEEGQALRCLVSGVKTVPSPTHPSIKGVADAQSSGAALISFNAPAFCSYGREQNINAPVSKYSAFAYTAALNYLISAKAPDGRRCFSKQIGDMTVVYWAENGEGAYQLAMSALLDGGDDGELDASELNKMMNDVAQGNPITWDETQLNPDSHFYILGLSPNAARLSVRIFLCDTFGGLASNIKKHYNRLEIVKPDFDKREILPLYFLLGETVQRQAKDKKPLPQMSGDTLRAILTNGRYPATLYQQTLLRIKADGEVTRGRAAIIKAYFLRNSNDNYDKEAATVGLNEDNNHIPYVLGRLFSVLENIQDSASGATTVKDRYFNSACATPAAVFPLILKLKNSHMKVLMRDKPGLGIKLETQVAKLLDRIGGEFPRHLLLNEQGAFILGYYHQTQKRFEKTQKPDSTNETDDGIKG